MLSPAVAAVVALAGSAQAAHWPLFGGDGGRSGHQAVGAGEVPVRFLYSRTGALDAPVRTSIAVTAGAAGEQRIAYGTVKAEEATSGDGTASANGRLHLRMLETGAAVGTEEGVRIDDGAADADVLGPPAGASAPASVGLVDSSTPDGPGQIFAVHNDDDQSETGDIAVAQLDVETGKLVRDEPLAGTEGFSIRSSPVLTPPDPEGARLLLFVAESGDDERLFRVPIVSAGATSAAIGAPTDTGDVDATPRASPTLLWLRAATGDPAAHVAVGTGPPASEVRTFAVADLAPGPASGDLGDAVQTPSVPVKPDGSPPVPAPAIHVAARTGDDTVVHTLVQNGNEQALSIAASSEPLGGAPAPALATSQLASEGGPTKAALVVTTGANLYVLDTEGLGVRGTLSDSPLEPGTSGFGLTTAAVAGDLAYATNDEGGQVVVGLDDGERVDAAGFSEDDGNAQPRADSSGAGQPAVSRSFVLFGGPKGVFAYVSRCGNPLAGTDGADEISGTRGGDRIAASGGADVARGRDSGDCVLGGAGDDALSGNAGDDRVSAGDGDDRAFGRRGDDGVSGNAGDDRVSANGGDDRAFGRRGDDGVSGNAGDDLVAGGGGDDSAFGRAGDDRLAGGTGADRLAGGAGEDAAVGHAGDDRMLGGAGPDLMRGLRGSDLLLGGVGDDRMAGHVGEDRLRGGVGDDNVFGRPGDDGISGNAGDDLLVGGPGRDRIFGRPGDDVVRARDGHRDVIRCGAGRDRAVVDLLDSARACERVARVF